MNLVPSFMVVRQLAMGDVLLATPIIRQLYQDHAGQCDQGAEAVSWGRAKPLTVIKKQ